MRTPKIALSAILASALILGPVSFARADMATPSPTSTPQMGIHNGPDGGQGFPDDHGQPSNSHPGAGGEHHRIDEGHEGADALQWIFVGAAIVIALGLAYNAGRRQRKKKAE
jgi:hypothetical protein